MREELVIKSPGMTRGQKVIIKDVPMNKIKLGRNSRLSMSKEDLSGLMQSINSNGLIHPIAVVESKDGKHYEIAAGHRRFMAFSKLGLHSIPAVIRQRKHAHDVDVMNLVENVQRRNISIAEQGRYAHLLEGEGLGKKELAVRMGCTVGYIDSCLTAWKEVPEEFRGDLEPRMKGQAHTPGKITIEAARAITNAGKGYGLTKPQKTILFKAAKSDDRFNPKQVPKYAAAIKEGSKTPIDDVRPVKTITFRGLMDERHYNKLMKEFVDNGPYKSFTELMKSVMEGKKAAPIKFID